MVNASFQWCAIDGGEMWRRVLAKSMFLLWRFLSDKTEEKKMNANVRKRRLNFTEEFLSLQEQQQQQ
ncbi:hypothetical protein T09_1252 [Trichinella sp. T9]|nr:hypothetical protein T09_1252 [Trichinella sp. T9]